MISFTLVIIFTHLYKHKYDLHNPFSVAHMYVISERTICHFSLIAYGSFNYRAVVSLEICSSPEGNHAAVLGSPSIDIGTLDYENEAVDGVSLIMKYLGQRD